jgi:ATP-dependent Clp protease ATP-binding subunit ClpB/ATP-dependent Clp protease ATP-binding subunit ClpC
MTSNAGSDKKDGYVGFARSLNEQGKEKALKALNDFLRPEFINRVDEVVYFNRLTEESFRKIARIMLEELKASLQEKGIGLQYDEAVLQYLTKKSYSLTYGARNLRRLIQKEIEDVVASRFIESYASPVTADHRLPRTEKSSNSCPCDKAAKKPEV